MAKLFVAKDVSQKMDDLAFKAEDAVHSMKKMARQNGIDTRPYHGEMKAIFQKIHNLSETFVTKIKGIESAKAADDTTDFPTNRPNDNHKSGNNKNNTSMKMSRDQYELLDIEVSELISSTGEKKVQDYRNNVKFANDQFTSFVWGIYHAISSTAKKEISKGLADAHIETALKKLLKKYK